MFAHYVSLVILLKMYLLNILENDYKYVAISYFVSKYTCKEKKLVGVKILVVVRYENDY